MTDEVIERPLCTPHHQRLELSTRDSHAFVEALLNPPPPNERLRETVAKYRAVIGV